jgi:hypothetical protein
VLGLRYYACDRCETVFADVETPPRCGRCAAEGLREITRDLQGDDYFWRATVGASADGDGRADGSSG